MDSDAETRRREALRQAFGESSGDEDDDAAAAFLPVSEQEVLKPRWESVEGIKGLWICREFLSEDHQSALLSAIEREGWFAESSHNQAMKFGDLPGWATELARLVREAVCFGEISLKGGKILIAEQQFTEDLCPLPFDLLWREPLFDQLIVNVYKAGEGICAHVDLMRFEDGIAVISMESACVMHFSQSEEGEEGSCRRIPVFLNPGSLILIIWGSTISLEARDKSQDWISAMGRERNPPAEEDIGDTEKALPITRPNLNYNLIVRGFREI